jgi:RHS repeat-associated protein
MRWEKKNVLGKVARVDDTNTSQLSFTYDVEGNLTDTMDPLPANNKIHIVYDLLGRKTLTKDPDLGQWTYTYNSFGDLVSQTDAKNQTTTMTYDVLGRMLTKTDMTTNATAEWIYDVAPGAGIGKLAGMVSVPDPNLKQPCTIPYTRMTDGNRTGRSFSYTPFGDVAQVDECIDGETFSTQYTYDAQGRQDVVTYPQATNSSRVFAVRYNYTSLGFLHSVTDANDPNNTMYWAATASNAAGQVTAERTRNGVETVSTRHPSTGWLMNSESTAKADNATLIQKWANTYDEAGNLRSRARSEPIDMADSLETFGYDYLERLTSAEVKVEDYDVTESFAYDKVGNLTQKGGKTYSYTGCTLGGGPHAVCQVGGGEAYSYDPNGNMVQGNGRKVMYNTFNKVSHIEGKLSAPGGASPWINFAYGADGNRVIQSIGTTASELEEERTVYVGMGGTGKSMYERRTSTATVEHVHFLYAGGVHGGNAFALRVLTEDRVNPSNPTTDVVRYQHFDHLGSITASTDDNGRVVRSSAGADSTVLGYDSWGARRSPDGRSATSYLALQPGHREFTGHETIPRVGLVNMNGRVYDPDLGRFLSPDPNVQFVADLQSYNRYTYAANNPLRYTDPTGYFISPAFDILVNMATTVAAIYVCAGTAGSGCAFAFALASTVYNTTSAVNNGAGWGQAIGMGLMSMAVGGVVGGFSGLIVGEEGVTAAGSVVMGAASGAVTSAIMTKAMGGNLGSNILSGAFYGAVGSAVAYAAQGIVAVSQASAAEQQGGEGTSEKSRTSGLGDRAPARPGIEVRVGDPNNWSPGDAYARTSDVLTFDIASGGETHTWTIREATAATGHEFGILYYSDEGGNVGYRLFEANSTDPENIHYTWNKGETPLAWVHTHPSEVDSELMFSMRDVRDAFKNQLPTYAVSTNMPGFNVVVGKDILGYIPSTTSVEAGYVRQF